MHWECIRCIKGASDAPAEEKKKRDASHPPIFHQSNNQSIFPIFYRNVFEEEREK
jgi:hypothetical protein